MFSKDFAKALNTEASRLAVIYSIPAECVIEEFRRLVLIKAFVVDTDAKKISPTPLSKSYRLTSQLRTNFE